MSKTLKYIAIKLVILAFGQHVFSQDVTNQHQHELHMIKNAWLSSFNPAGLVFSDYIEYGISDLGYQRKSGDLHRAQEGSENGGMVFNSERYNKIAENWYTYGRFEFQMNREKNRNYSNNFNTFNDSPYIFGDTVKGTYDKQSFDLNAKITRQFGSRLAAGVGINYFAADVSRIRDPRTRTFLVNYGINPGLIFKINNQHKVGINGGIGFEKEKMPSITTIQTDPKIDYYFFLGNENAYSVLDGYNGFDRQYVTFSYQGSIQHSINKTNWMLHNALAFESRTQEILGSERQSPGSFESQKLSFDSKFYYIFDSKLLLNIQLNSYYKHGIADEFLQERIEERDTITGAVSRKWQTLFKYENRYITDSYQTLLNIDLRKLTNKGNDYQWLMGTRVAINGFNNQYFLPYSAFESQNIAIGLYGAMPLLNKNKHRLNLRLSTDYGWALINNVELNNLGNTVPGLGATNFEKATYNIAQKIVLQDANLLNQSTINIGVSANYSFPVKLKTSSFTGQIKFFYNYIEAQTLGNNNIFGASIGLVTF